MENTEWVEPTIEKITDFNVHESVIATSEYQIPNQDPGLQNGGFYNG